MSMNWNDPQLLPHDVDAERSFIGSAIINPDVIIEHGNLTKFDFYNSALGEVWAIMQEMVSDGRSVDLVTLAPEIKARDNRVNIDNLIGLVAETPDSLHAADYARIIKQYAKRRGAIRLADRLANAGYSGNGIDSKIFKELEQIAGGDEVAQPLWKIHTVGDALQDREPTQYIVEDILPRGSLNIWYGASGSKKSFLLADLAMCCVAGAGWLPGNGKQLNTEQCSVLWIDTDNGRDVSHERFGALARARNIKPDDPFYYISMPNPWLDMSDINSHIDLRTTIQNLKTELVIIDNLGNVSGDIEENTADMVKVMLAFRQISEDLGTTFIVIHHIRKGGSNGSRAGDALRGHSSIEASLDFAVRVSSEKGSNEAYISCTKARRFEFDDLRAQLNVDHFPGTRDARLAWWTTPVPVRGENPIRDAIIEVLEANGKITQERLLESVYEFLNKESGKTKIRSWIKEMSDITNELEIEKGPYNANIYSLK